MTRPGKGNGDLEGLGEEVLSGGVTSILGAEGAAAFLRVFRRLVLTLTLSFLSSLQSCPQQYVLKETLISIMIMRTTSCLQTKNQIILKTLSSSHWALVSGNWDHISPLLTHSSGPVSLWRLSLEFLDFYMDRYKLLEPAWVGAGDVQRSLVRSEQSDEVVWEDPGPALQRPLPPAGVLQLLGHHRHHLHMDQWEARTVVTWPALHQSGLTWPGRRSSSSVLTAL